MAVPVKIPPPPELGANGICYIIMLVVALVLMAGDWVGPDLTMSTLLAIALTCRFLTLAQATAGYGNSGLLSVMALYIVAEGVTQTGGLARAISFTTGRANTITSVFIRMLIPAMAASAFINNTPIVAVLIPIVMSWARRNGQSPKPVLLCLSYSAVLGGTCTMIGTSTNLVVGGFYSQQFKGQTIGMFDIAPYGLAYAAWGIIFLVSFSRLLLNGDDKSKKGQEELLVGLLVPKGSPLAGATIESAGLRNLEDLYLVSVTRDDTILHAVGPDFTMKENDILSFCGDLTMVGELSARFKLPIVNSESDDAGEAELGQSSNSLLQDQSSSDLSSDLLGTGRLVLCTVKMGSELVGKQIRDIGFARRFNAKVVAVKRPTLKKARYVSKKVEGKLPDIVLESGDEVLLDVRSDFDAESQDVLDNFEKEVRWMEKGAIKDYTTGFSVYKGSSLIGKTVQEVGLVGMTGIYLAQLDRADGTVITPVAPSTVIEEGDAFWFNSDIHGLSFLFDFQGMRHFEKGQIAKANVDKLERRLVQVVVAKDSPLIGHSVRESRFRTKYNAAIVGVQRKGERIKQKIGDIVLNSGDLLLLDAGKEFLKDHDSNRSVFALVSEVPNSSPKKKRMMWIALLLLVAMITVQVVQDLMAPKVKWIDLWPAATLTGVIMIIIRCMTWEQAKRSMDATVFLTIAASFGISEAMRNTGVAGNIAWLFIQLGIRIGGQAGILSCVYIVTALLSEMLTNNAAAAIMYPIASLAGKALGIDPKLMAYCLMLGASAGFVSPYGYQCNLMVFSAGQMRFWDFARVGVPFALWQWLGATLTLAWPDQIYVVMGIMMGAAAVVCTIALAGDKLMPYIEPHLLKLKERYVKAPPQQTYLAKESVKTSESGVETVSNTLSNASNGGKWHWVQAVKKPFVNRS